MQIEDGLGNAYAAGVDRTKRLMVHAVNVDAIDAAAERGEAFNLTTDVVTLTSTAESGVLYVMNSDAERNLILARLAFSFGKASTSGDVIVKTYANPTSGTLLSAGTPITFLQRNLGSRLVAQGTALRAGAVGQTQIGGTLIATRVFQDAREHEVNAGWLIPAGSGLAITVQPPTGNTSMRAAITVACYYADRPKTV